MMYLVSCRRCCNCRRSCPNLRLDLRIYAAVRRPQCVGGAADLVRCAAAAAESGRYGSASGGPHSGPGSSEGRLRE